MGLGAWQMALGVFLRLGHIILAQLYYKIVPVISLNSSTIIKDRIFENGSRQSSCL